ncbi:MAG: AraC family transcriptional regulator [Bacteroidota bacterium]
MTQVVPRSFELKRDQYPELWSNGRSYILRKQQHQPVTEGTYFIAQPVINLVLNGEKVVYTNEGERLHAPAGHLILIPKDVYVLQDIVPENEAYDSLLFFYHKDVLLSIADRLDLSMNARTPKLTPIVLRMSSVVAEFAESISRQLKLIQHPPASLIQLKLQELIQLILLDDPGPAFTEVLNHLDLGKTRDISSFMEANYTKPLTIKDFAYLTGRSVSSFNREFRELFGDSPKSWVLNRRMEMAKQLVEQNSASMSSIAAEVGYENLSQFSASFKNHFKVSPSEYGKV